MPLSNRRRISPSPYSAQHFLSSLTSLFSLITQGHLRSTIIGDCLSRVLAFLGHDVLRVNHVGDWGTQFGMLIAYVNAEAEAKERESGEVAHTGDSVEVYCYPHHYFLTLLQLATHTSLDLLEHGIHAATGNMEIQDLVEFYKAAKRRFDSDPAFQQAARAEVVALQAGRPESLASWRAICAKSRVEFDKVYSLLGVKDLLERGESFYNPMLPALVARLKESGVAVESEGAQCIFLEGFKNSDGTPLPLVRICC